MKKKPAAPGKIRRRLPASHPCCRDIAVQYNKYKQKIKNQEKFPKTNHLKNTDIQLWVRPCLLSTVFCLPATPFRSPITAVKSCMGENRHSARRVSAVNISSMESEMSVAS